MDIGTLILIVIGLGLFETITSIDNAIINAQVLSTMQPWARRWFLVWGLLSAVFLMRGLLPWLIVWAAVPSLGPVGAMTATFSGDAAVVDAVAKSAPVLLIGGGSFLIFLFFHWLFLEPKHYGLPGERVFRAAGGLVLRGRLRPACRHRVVRAEAGSDDGVRCGRRVDSVLHHARLSGTRRRGPRRDMMQNRLSDWSKIFYLEVIDATFSIDGVIGAFAFTLSVPLILIGNGLGAIVVRQITVGNIERIRKYRYLKNGAMYSVLFLGVIMLLESFGLHVPIWLSPIITFGVVGFFFAKSWIVLYRARSLK